MQIYIHQTHHTIADFDEIFTYLDTLSHHPDFEGNIHLFPESFLCGYPLQDLCLQKDFIDNYLQSLTKINLWWSKLNLSKDTALLMGGLEYTFDANNNPIIINNCLYELKLNSTLTNIYNKQLLPNYDIFDEAKYYTPGKESLIWEFSKYRFGVLICEDMWASSQYDVDPVRDLLDLAKDTKLNAIFNFSASPFYLGKEESRLSRVREIYDSFQVPYFYVNRVGSEDEIIFDGASFVFDDNKIIHKAVSFKEDKLNCAVSDAKIIKLKKYPQKLEHSWAGVFRPRLVNNDGKIALKTLSDSECEQILHALNLGIQDYANKTGMNKFLVALSGGMDSALVLALLKLFLRPGQEIEAIYMPGQYSASLSWELSKKLCDNIGIKLNSLPIKFLHSTIRGQFKESLSPLENIADENIQSRLRGALIYARSNQTGAMVLNTSNKSEIAVGYSTMYGDSVGALSPLGDLYKSEVFTLAHYINTNFKNIIPEGIINRAPSAELRENQEDSQSLPKYEILDTILEAHLSYRYSQNDLLDEGLNEEHVEKVLRLCKNSEYKRFQFCPIIKLKSKSFGFGRRIPLAKK